MTPGTVVLAKQAKSLHQSFHPWIFSGSIRQSPPANDTGQPVRVVDDAGRFVAWGQHNPGSKIEIRVLSWDEGTIPDRDFYAIRLRQALLGRQNLQDSATTAVRLVFSEADGLPGLIVDRIGDILVAQFLTFGMDANRQLIVELLQDLAPTCLPKPFRLAAIVERSDGDGRRLEGLAERNLVLSGNLPSGAQTIVEHGHVFQVDLGGQKTGFYTDQRENRRRVAAYAKGARVLDVCSYTGGFSVYAQAAGAKSCTLIDSSAQALAEANHNLQGGGELIEGDAFQLLRQLQAKGQSYDLIILDPPKLAPNRSSLPRAAAAYKDLNLQALKLAQPGTIIASFSCSGLVTAADLRLWIAYAAKDSRRRVQILEQLHQAPCHPIALNFPESEYLKGFILRVQD